MNKTRYRFLLFRCALVLLTVLGVVRASPAQTDGVNTIDSSMFHLERGEDCVDLTFLATTAVDLLRIPVVSEKLWGLDRIGRTVSVRSDHAMNVATREGSASWIIIPLADGACRRIRLWSILSDPRFPESSRIAGIKGDINGDAGGEGSIERESYIDDQIDKGRSIHPNIERDGDWVVEGISGVHREQEHLLERLAKNVAERQSREGCFSCHELIPLGTAAIAARDLGLRIPEELLASLTKDLGGMQYPDGAFRFPRRPEYGEVTPTVAAAVFLGWSRRWKPEAASMLVRAVRFLLTRQSDDGSLRPDFTFPPWMLGTSFSTRMFLEALCQAELIFSRNGRLENSEFSTAKMRARDWIASRSEEALIAGRFDESLFALPYGGTIGEASRTARITLFSALLSEFRRGDSLERFSLLIQHLVLLGGRPPAFERGLFVTESDQRSSIKDMPTNSLSRFPKVAHDFPVSKALWGLLADIWLSAFPISP
ncbi:MAG: hypothetical protein WA705_14120 [Candidatus Ozemobacteraceae bacterium]